MPSFTNTRIGVGTIYDAYCTVVFTKQDVTLLSPKGKAIITGWGEKKLPRLWRFALKPTDEFSTCPLAVPTLIFSALVTGVPCGADGAM